MTAPAGPDESPAVHRSDVSQFKEEPTLLDGQRWALIVKSRDQTERRRRMTRALNAGSVMRVSLRPVAAGALLLGSFRAGKFVAEKTFEHIEPRHLIRDAAGGFLLTEVDSVACLDERFRVRRRIEHPHLAFLHTLDLSADARNLLVCSTGFDAVVEFDLETGSHLWTWSAWEHGFNPDADGTWLTLHRETHEARVAAGVSSALLSKDADGPLGSVCRHRSAHPNMARYDPYAAERSFVVNIAYTGELFRVRFRDGAATFLRSFGVMSHGLERRGEGWSIVDTTRGMYHMTDSEFRVEETVVLTAVGGRHPEAGDREWVQQGVRMTRDRMLFVDANRGLIGVDLKNQGFGRYAIDGEFCIQDALLLADN